MGWQEGADFARAQGCLYVETSAKTNVAVSIAFEELVLKILDTPELLDDRGGPRGSGAGGIQLTQADSGYSSCSC